MLKKIKFLKSLLLITSIVLLSMSNVYAESLMSLQLLKTEITIEKGTNFGNIKRLANISSATDSNGDLINSTDYGNLVSTKVSPDFKKDEPGEYIIKYTLKDPLGTASSATANLKLIVKASKLSLTLKESEIAIKQGTAFGKDKRLANIASATDLDGNPIDSANYGDYITTKANPTFDRNIPGEYIITYTLKDPLGIASPVKTDLKLTVLAAEQNSELKLDLVKEKITIDQGTDFGNAKRLANIESAYDSKGNLIDSADYSKCIGISVKPSFDKDTPGTYVFTYTLTDPLGVGEPVTKELTLTVKKSSSSGSSSSSSTTVMDPVLATNDPYVYEGTSSISDSNTTSATTTAAIINAKDIKINVGESFNIMNNVKATDIDGNDITSKVTASGAVNTAKAGTYKVNYKVVDKNGNKISKQIKVIVSELVIKGPQKCDGRSVNSPCY